MATPAPNATQTPAAPAPQVLRGIVKQVSLPTFLGLSIEQSFLSVKKNWLFIRRKSSTVVAAYAKLAYFFGVVFYFVFSFFSLFFVISWLGRRSQEWDIRLILTAAAEDNLKFLIEICDFIINLIFWDEKTPVGRRVCNRHRQDRIKSIENVLKTIDLAIIW